MIRASLPTTSSPSAPATLAPLWRPTLAPEVTARPAAPLAMLPTTPASRPASDAVDASVVARTYQIDGIPTTESDTTRCAGAAAVAIASMTGQSYVTALARVVEKRLGERTAEVAADIEAYASEDPSVRADAAGRLLVELEHYVAATGYVLRNVVEAVGFEPAGRGTLADAPAGGNVLALPSDFADSGFVVVDAKGKAIHVGPSTETGGEMHLGELPAHLDGASYTFYRLPGKTLDAASLARIAMPSSERTIDWLWSLPPQGDGALPLSVAPNKVSLSLPMSMLAVAQLAGGESTLWSFMSSYLEGELAETHATRQFLDRGTPTHESPLQELADQFVFVARQSSRGVNNFYVESMLREAGFSTRAPLQTGAAPFAESATLVGPGESLCLQNSRHATSFGRSADGTCYLYDSEGLFGDRANPTLVTLGRNPDLGPSSEVGRYYQSFISVLKVGKQPPRLAAKSELPWRRAA